MINRIGLEIVSSSQKKKFIAIGLWQYIRKIKNIVKIVRIKCASLLVLVVAGRAASLSFQAGIFRSSGEVHRWMYDQYSLKRVLERIGFIDIKICQAAESRIPSFNSYSFDVLDGVVRKPDSLFIEATKP